MQCQVKVLKIDFPMDQKESSIWSRWIDLIARKTQQLSVLRYEVYPARKSTCKLVKNHSFHESRKILSVKNIAVSGRSFGNTFPVIPEPLYTNGRWLQTEWVSGKLPEPLDQSEKVNPSHGIACLLDKNQFVQLKSRKTLTRFLICFLAKEAIRS